MNYLLQSLLEHDWPLIEHCARAQANILLEQICYNISSTLVKDYSSTLKYLLEHGTRAEVNIYLSKLFYRFSPWTYSNITRAHLYVLLEQACHRVFIHFIFFVFTNWNIYIWLTSDFEFYSLLSTMLLIISLSEFQIVNILISCKLSKINECLRTLNVSCRK